MGLRHSLPVLALAGIFAMNAAYADEVELDHRPSRQELAAGRDLATYEDGGEMQEIELDEAAVLRIRAFIWDHWLQKKRCCFTFRWVNMDSGADEYMFSEPSP